MSSCEYLLDLLTLLTCLAVNDESWCSHTKWMRGFGVLLSPDSPGSDAVKTRTEPGNPEARNTYPQSIIAIYR
uniref:Uncharacterized protein n=1 Tax=Ignisphaera aggregans TaxID=334771 RepID=A0A7J2U5T7_9CREN